ncbi:calcium uptake protein 3, mitochondrial-like isoform X2 [Synchiropus splendidus]|uniref:calcium uptake protein 3, mitochondrial-like isoform X2 n=1 Tax=Synchiropus splendidus TaxID=270530 RepID=UPI00237E83AA|nr:calcium uptake protein 3, mitochondrial-like isoform X2 [Synchiropus splendidus]
MAAIRRLVSSLRSGSGPSAVKVLAAGAGVGAAAGTLYYQCGWWLGGRSALRSQAEDRLLHLVLPSVAATDDKVLEPHDPWTQSRAPRYTPGDGDDARARTHGLDDGDVYMSSYESRFRLFSSVEHEGQLFMTPRNFIESITLTEPQGRRTCKSLTKKELDRILADTPPVWKGSSNMFRNLRDQGIISYTEYLFLLCILTKPHAGFRIAFNMFDADGNEMVDQREFLVLGEIFRKKKDRTEVSEDVQKFDLQKRLLLLQDLKDLELKRTWVLQQDNDPKRRHKSVSGWRRTNKMESEFLHNHKEAGSTTAVKALSQLLLLLRPAQPVAGLRGITFSLKVLKKEGQHAETRGVWEALKRGTSHLLFSDLAEHAEEKTETTLLVHFFGKKGKAELKFEDFYKFMDNLQTELLEIEFLSYSKGMPTISEEDFARILLRYTNVDDVSSYLENVRHCMQEEKGIVFEEFRSFFQFLNNLEDFAIAMQMYNFANRSIGQEEFSRAVYVATGIKLSHHLVNTVFKIFDEDHDGKLSHKEFIGVMKERLHRGNGGVRPEEKHTSFRSCMRRELAGK